MVDANTSIPEHKMWFLYPYGGRRSPVGGQGCGPQGRRTSQTVRQPQTACTKGFPQPGWGSGSPAGHCRVVSGPQPTVSTGGRAPSPFPLPQQTAGPGGPITSLCGSEWEQHGCARCRYKSSIRPGGHQMQAGAGCPWLWFTSPVTPHVGGQSPGGRGWRFHLTYPSAVW